MITEDDIFTQSKRVLLSERGVRLASVYGSVAAGKMHATSDVDIAVLFDHALSADEKMALRARLEEALPKPVDLVDMFSLSGTILKQILCEGRVVVKKSAEELARLTRRMIYNQADMMPYVRRTLRERQERFVHES